MISILGQFFISSTLLPSIFMRCLELMRENVDPDIMDECEDHTENPLRLKVGVKTVKLVNDGLENIDAYTANIKTFVADMLTTIKIGKKMAMLNTEISRRHSGRDRKSCTL